MIKSAGTKGDAKLWTLGERTIEVFNQALGKPRLKPQVYAVID
jgi:hypothetical protein